MEKFMAASTVLKKELGDQDYVSGDTPDRTGKALLSEPVHVHSLIR
jgi:hypothetical protein